MIIFYLLYLLSSNSVSLLRDKTILYSRISIIALISTNIIIIYGLNPYSIEKSVGLFAGLFNPTPNSYLFQIVLYLISAIILQLTGFYPRKITIPQYCSIQKVLQNKLIYYNTNILEKTDNKYKILEYALIILFIISGASFLLSSNDLVSIFLSIFLFALLFLLFNLKILLIYHYIVASYTIIIYDWVIMLITFLLLTLGFQFELGKKALNLYSRQLDIIKYIYTLKISKQSNVFHLLDCFETKIFLKDIFNEIFNIIIYKVRGYLKARIEDTILYIYNKYFLKELLLGFKKLVCNKFSMLFANIKIFTIIVLIIVLILTSLFLWYYPERFNICIIINLYSIYIHFILLILFTVLFVYINIIDINFKNKYPFLYMFINFLCVVVIISCILGISLNIYNIFKEILNILYKTPELINHYIYKMMSMISKRLGGSTGNPDPSPAGGGGKPPGKGPNGNPNRGGSDKPDVFYSEEEEEEQEEESSLSDEDNEWRGPNIKYTGGSKQGVMEPLEKKEISLKRKHLTGKRYAESDKGKATKKRYRESEKGAKIIKESEERYLNSTGKDVKSEYQKSEAYKTSHKKSIEKYKPRRKVLEATKLANETPEHKKARLESRRIVEKNRIKNETFEQREARLARKRMSNKKSSDKKTKDNNKENKKDKK